MYFSTTDTAAILGVSPKRLDNLCGRVGNATFATGTQGRARQFTPHDIELLAITLLVARDLAIPLRKSATLASRVLSADQGRVAVGSIGSVQFDIPRLREVLHHAIAASIQDREPLRRGRPRGRKKRGASL